MQGSQAEVTRLMKCVAKSRKNFCRLQWNNAYFSDPEAFFSSVVSVSIIPAYKSMLPDHHILTFPSDMFLQL